MAGGILQLLSYGAADVYFTANPQITFFKVVYRRHTNFSQQLFENGLTDSPDFGSKHHVRIFRLGDLMTNMFIMVDIASVTPNVGSKFAWIRRLGHALLKSVEIEMGGVVFDRQYGEWLDIWYELARSGKHERGYLAMIGDVPELTTLNDQIKPAYRMIIPLKFWFNRHTGLALPLVAIQYHEIYINIEFNKRETLLVSNCNFTGLDQMRIVNASIFIEYIYLEDSERYRFSYVPHEYLIEQVQHDGDESVDRDLKRVQLLYNYPVKELVWIGKNGYFLTGRQFLCYTNTDDWASEIQRCSRVFLEQSIILLQGPIYLRDQYGNIAVDAYGNRIILVPGAPPPSTGVWEEFPPEFTGTTKNGQITVTNNSKDFSLWVNADSLNIQGVSITGKISAFITVSTAGGVAISNLVSNITDHDISFPVDMMVDTRLSSDTDVCVRQFNNYGLLISGRIDPFEYTQLDYNNVERFQKRNYRFFNYLMPEMHHTNTPADGVNVYSFALKPEEHQPSGTSNFSRIEKIIMTFWFRDFTQIEPPINFVNPDSLIYIYAFNYNVLRISNGLTGLAYNG
jgi:hypothetical protein